LQKIEKLIDQKSEIYKMIIKYIMQYAEYSLPKYSEGAFTTAGLRLTSKIKIAINPGARLQQEG